MRARQARRDIRPLLLGCLLLAGCHRDDAPANGIVVIDGRQAVAMPAKAAPRPMPSASPTAIPTIAASPPGPNPQLAKPAFRSPPLPRELTDDGGLIPLPPLPPASAFTQGNQH